MLAEEVKLDMPDDPAAAVEWLREQLTDKKLADPKAAARFIAAVTSKLAKMADREGADRLAHALNIARIEALRCEGEEP